jgi:AraC-like DNA-binding protein
MISFLARHGVVDVHYHQCFQVVVSLGSPFNSFIDGVPYEGLCGVYMNQYIPHACQSQDTDVLVYFIESESALGWQLKDKLGDTPFIPILEIPPITDTNMARFAEGLLYRLVSGSSRAGTAVGGSLEPGSSHVGPTVGGSRAVPRPEMDPRIGETLIYIDEHLDEPLALEEVAAQIFLSTERFRHLFVDQTGVPFSQYVLWRRIKRVMCLVLQDGLPMSTAAVQNGFTDQSHFARLFRRTFGVSAKALLKNSRYVQFLSPLIEIALPS